MKIVFIKEKMNELVISEIQIIPVNPKNGLLAFASFVINNSIYIGDVAIHNCLGNSEGYRLVYPDRVLANGKRINCVYPITKEAGNAITRAVVSEYKEILSKLWRQSENGDSKAT